MPTPRQIEANRRNAQKSTGPTSVTGKAASSMNALKTGIHAKSLVLPTENVAELEELVEDCYRSLHPTTPEARPSSTSSSTANGPSAASVPPKPNRGNTRIDTFSGPQKYPLGYSATQHSNSFSKLQYRMDATRRARERALQSLKQLQVEAAAAPAPPLPNRPTPPNPPSLTTSPQTASPLIGFVLPTPSAAPPEPPVAGPPDLR